MIQAIFTDVDNTLTSGVTRKIPPSALEAIATARKNGVLVFAATGRHTRTREEGAILDGIELDGYVAINGQLCYLTDGTVIHKEILDPGDVAIFARFARERDIAFSVTEIDRVSLNKVDDAVLAFHEGIQIPLYPMDPMEDLVSRELYAIGPYFVGEAGEAELRALLPHSALVRFNPYNFDIIPRVGGKDVGMLKMLEHFQIPREACMALGDGENDIAMLRVAGVGVAMGGSAPAVREAADFLAPAPDEDGVWKTFRRYGII